LEYEGKFQNIGGILPTFPNSKLPNGL